MMPLCVPYSNKEPHSMATYDYGMIGLGTMGRNLVYNMSDNGFSVAGYDPDAKQRDTLVKNAPHDNVSAFDMQKDFVAALKAPRTILLLVPAGKVVDQVIGELKPLLSKDDLIIDCGNSHYIDTDRRIEELANTGIQFMGVGVSGGEEGARFGPSIMPGGNPDVYHRVDKMFAAIAAKADGEPCVKYLGNKSAGHYVKMVHNGIEYGLMQLIAESYNVLKTIGGLSNAEMHEVYSKWNEGKLKSFLIEITADIFTVKDSDAGTQKDLVDVVMDTAHQKGTGIWTSKSAMELQIPIPVIDTAVTSRYYSAMRSARLAIAKSYEQGEVKPADNKQELIDKVEDALYFAMIITYTQGLELLAEASKKQGYGLNIEDIARIWRGGCIIRSAFLENIARAYESKDITTLLSDKATVALLKDNSPGIRDVICHAVNAGIPVPALSASISYFDSYRNGWLPANLIQAQRDYFGAHTYERLDKEGTFHSIWHSKK